MSISLRALLPICFSISILSSAALAGTLQTQFASAEHVAIGSNIYLHFTHGDHGVIDSKLSLPNGFQLNYGELISLGDFYGVPERPISRGNSAKENIARFKEAVATFASPSVDFAEMTAILGVLHAEIQDVVKGLANNEKPEDIYKKIGHEYDRQLNCITGGSCDKKTWWLIPGKYVNLGAKNFDHFGDNAITAYKIGHQVALEQAVIAHQNHDVTQLEYAYALNGFACHFLTDRFSAGHIRTPRVELYEQTHTLEGITLLLANYMHDEENEYGLHVHNQRGDHWMAYGDKSYFSPQSEEHRKKIIEAVQYSTDEVFAAYVQGTTKIKDTVSDLIPQPDETAATSSLDVSPLFYWDNDAKKLMRRQDMTNYHDKNWTDNWWAWTTLIELARERGSVADKDQVLLAKSEFAEKALQAGLITNPDIIRSMRRSK